MVEDSDVFKSSIFHVEVTTDHNIEAQDEWPER